jgi:two-component system, NarL family, nitrate/nitrite response regulator NarL
LDANALNAVPGAPGTSAVISVLVVGSEQCILEALGQALSRKADMDVFVALSVEQAEEMIQAQDSFDVVLLNFGELRARGLEALQALIKANGRGVAIIAGSLPSPFVEQALRSGAMGYLPTTLNLSAFEIAIRFLASGDQFLPWQYTHQRRIKNKRLVLSETEYLILSCLCEGLTNRDISTVLGIEILKLKRFVSEIFVKIGVENRTQAMLRAVRDNLLSAYT